MAFTSDLSGQEFWLVVDKGYIPLGLVLGNSVYSMGALGGCAAQQPAKPDTSNTSPDTSKTSSTLSRDAYECEQKAAFAGVGSRAAAFDDCMKNRGRTPNNK